MTEEIQLSGLKARKKKDLKSQFQSMTSDQLDALAQQTVFVEIRRTVAMKDFGQFCRDHPTTTTDNIQQQSRLF